MVGYRSWGKIGLSVCVDNEEFAQRRNSICDVSLCVITPRDTNWMAVGLELKMVPTSPSRPALGGETSWQRWTTVHTLWCNLPVLLFSEHYVSRCSDSALQRQSYLNIITAGCRWNNSSFSFKKIWLKDHLESVRASVLQITYQRVMRSVGLLQFNF